MFENLPANIIHAQPQPAEQSDVLEMIKSALEKPLYFPPINEWLFPGDSLAILLQSNLPQPRAIIKQILDACQQLNVSLDDVLVVISPQMASRFDISTDQQQQSESEIANGNPPAIIPVDIEGESVSFQVHDPENRNGLSYLAANEAGDPVHINRQLADADVVMPVGCPTPGDQPRLDCLYPEFGSAERLDQFKSGAGSANQRTQEIELANNNLGTFFSIEIVTAPGGQIAHVVAGSRHDVFKASREFADELWTVEIVPERDTVLATIEEQGRQHTWEDFTDAIIAAANVSNGRGPIVLWTSIEQSVDRNTRKALMSQFDDSINSKLSVRLRTLAGIVSERPVFLRSSLSQSQTEELGLGYIGSESDVETILAKSETGVVLRDAHRCRINHTSHAAS